MLSSCQHQFWQYDEAITEEHFENSVRSYKGNPQDRIDSVFTPSVKGRKLGWGGGGGGVWSFCLVDWFEFWLVGWGFLILFLLGLFAFIN